MSEKPPDRALDEIRRERDLYLRLLELGSRSEVEPFLEDALALIVEATEAQRGYIELRDHAANGAEPAWSMSHGFSDAEIGEVREQVSRGIIAEALSTGQLVDTPSALLDPRFRDRGSVRMRMIEAVLCVPIGEDPPRGVLYLQGRAVRAPFEAAHRELALRFARHLAPLADNLLLRRRTDEATDPTRVYRAKLRLDGVIGRSAALAAVLRDVSLVAPLDVNVLLTGDSGTGKTQIARVIHDNGPRAAGPLVELNCAALPETLIESELFGALRGGHATATHEIPGKVKAAEGGTLLLDEVAELPLGAQSKLLQLLQSRQYYPLGAARPERADVRVIAATNCDLEAAVAEGRFREDLFYRLRVLPIRIPSLAERRTDVPDLARFFLARACERHRLPQVEFSSAALRAIEAAEWPGNVRELEHAVEVAAIRAAGERLTRVERGHVFPEGSDAARDPEDGELTFQQATQAFQRELLRDTLDVTGWNVAATARRLDLARSHVYNLIRALGLERGKG